MHPAWAIVPVLAFAGGALHPGPGGFGHPLLVAEPPAPLQPPRSVPLELGAAGPDGWTGSCAGHCVLDLPAGPPRDWWVSWDGSRTPGFGAALEGEPWAFGVPAFDAIRLAGAGGAGRLHVWGDGDLQVVAVPDAADGLPNLVAIQPAHLGRAPPREAREAAGCLPEEAAAGARLCLRFSSGMANTGDRALELAAHRRVAGDAAVRLLQATGGGERAAGEASYHATHGHFHYDGFVTFELHPFDPATGLRAEAVASRAKTGFCVVDWGRLEEAGPAAPAKAFWRADCDPGASLRMGVSPGWYDLYRWFLPEQHLDVAGLPDGSYELVVAVDPAGTVAESTVLDNRASLRFTYRGGEAVPLEGRGLYHL